MSILPNNASDNARDASVDADYAKHDLFKAAKILDDIEIEMHNIAKKIPKDAPASVTQNVALHMTEIKRHSATMREHIEKLHHHAKELEKHVEEANRRKAEQLKHAA